MLWNNINKVLCLLLSLLFSKSYSYAQNQNQEIERYIIVKDTVPCFLDFYLTGHRFRPSATIPPERMTYDSIAFSREVERSKLGSKDLIYICKEVLHRLRISGTYTNNSDVDTLAITQPTGEHGAFQFELYKITPSKVQKIYFDNIGNDLHWYEEIIEPRMRKKSIVTLLHVDYNEIDTGEYKIRCSYYQKCNGKTQKRYSNFVHFFVIN